MDGVDNWRDADSVGWQQYAGITSSAGQTISSESKPPFLLRINSIFHSVIIIFKQNPTKKNLPNQINSHKANQTGQNQTKLDMEDCSDETKGAELL